MLKRAIFAENDASKLKLGPFGVAFYSKENLISHVSESGHAD